MTTDQELQMDAQSATAVFAANGIDVTPNKDQGVLKVYIVNAAFLTLYCTVDIQADVGCGHGGDFSLCVFTSSYCLEFLSQKMLDSGLSVCRL